MKRKRSILASVLLVGVGSILWFGRGFTMRQAASHGNLKVMRFLLACDHNLVSSRDGYLQTPLHFAAANGQKQAAALLLANGADVEAMTYLGATPLQMAAGRDDEDMMELLLANHADINGRDKDGFRQSALFNAVMEHHGKMVDFLIQHHADVNVPDYFGRTPLYIAAQGGEKPMVELLLANHADIDAKDNDGDTPLALAVKYGKDDMAGLLRSHGARQ